MKQHLNWTKIDPIINRALMEDIGPGDVTSLAMQVELKAEAEIVSKQTGILSGVDVAKRVFQLHDNSLDIQ
ncbi:MAG: nicotinate-nucleotide diphosphorylase (carboxylating), partial [Candidatus Marinimicrobia bacterium]|nr:nicotinate-nucleotide diphosphorylase (carboxylating) [Candidatus Neomarinimicrobiota bacterium]